MFTSRMPERNSEAGIGLTTLVVSLAVLAIIATGITMTIHQIFNISSSSTNHMVAIQQVQNAGRWLVKDGLKASSIELTQDADGFPLTISWSDTEDNEHEAVYTILVNDSLRRQYYINRTQNPNPLMTSSIIGSVNLSQTSCNISPSNELVASISVPYELGSETDAETRVYRVFPRQSLN